MNKMPGYFIAVLFFAGMAMAQTVPDSYGFLEVVDFDGKPIKGAEIATKHSGYVLKSGEDGRLEGSIRFRPSVHSFPKFSIEHKKYFPLTDYFNISFSHNGSWSTKQNPVQIKLIEKNNEKLFPEQWKRDAFAAARTGNENKLRELLSVGVDPNLTTSDLLGIPAAKDVPLIRSAARSGQPVVVDVLLDAGVRLSPEELGKVLNIFLRYGRALPLEKAEYENVAIRLIKSGATLETSEPRQTGPIHHSVEKRLFRVTKELVEKGASLESRNSSLQTPLMLAVTDPSQSNSKKVVDLLLSGGAKINAISETPYRKECYTAFMMALINEKYEVAEFLLSRGAVGNAICANGKGSLEHWFEGFSFDNEKRARIKKKLLDFGIFIKSDQ